MRGAKWNVAKGKKWLNKEWQNEDSMFCPQLTDRSVEPYEAVSSLNQARGLLWSRAAGLWRPLQPMGFSGTQRSEDPLAYGLL